MNLPETLIFVYIYVIYIYILANVISTYRYMYDPCIMMYDVIWVWFPSQSISHALNHHENLPSSCWTKFAMEAMTNDPMTHGRDDLP